MRVKIRGVLSVVVEGDDWMVVFYIRVLNVVLKRRRHGGTNRQVAMEPSDVVCGRHRTQNVRMTLQHGTPVSMKSTGQYVRSLPWCQRQSNVIYNKKEFDDLKIQPTSHLTLIGTY